MKNMQIVAASVALDVDGLGDAVTGASFTLLANDAGDNLAHLIEVLNNTATDHTGKTLLITGTGPNGEPQTETITGPDNASTTITTKHFLTVTSVVPSATIGADTFDIGWTAESVSAWIPVAPSRGKFEIGFGCKVVAATPNYTIEVTHGSGYAIAHSTLTGETTDQIGAQDSPIRAFRLKFTVAGSVTVNAVQGGV